jgi:hypothetical protein
MSNEKGVILSGAKLRNVFGFGEVECKFKDGANYIYGKNGSGKSKLTLDGLWSCIKGIAEQGEKFLASRFQCIGKNSASGDFEYEFTDRADGSTFVIKNHITNAANKITFQKTKGDPIPDSFLDDFLNVSLLSARNFCRMKPTEQALALGINTAAFDANIAKYKEERKIETRMLKELGVPEPVEEVEPVDIEVLKAKKKEVSAKLNTLYLQNREANKILRQNYEALVEEERGREAMHDIEMQKRVNDFTAAQQALSTLCSIGYTGGEVALFICNLPKEAAFASKEIPVPEYKEEILDSTEIATVDLEIEEAHATNAKAASYLSYQAKLAAIKKREDVINGLNERIEEEEKERINYITSKKFPFAGMTTDDYGGLLFKDRPINEQSFSKGELEIIVAKLAASQNPLFMTRFIDEFGVLDPDNQKKLVNDLIAEGFQVIISIPGERVEHDNAIVLRDCKIVSNEETDERPELL